MLSAGQKQGLEAYITREDGTRFTEHQVIHTEATADKPSTSSCFLESEEGSIFKIVLDTRSAFTRHPTLDWQIHTSVDGRQIDRLVRRKTNGHASKIATMISKEGGQLFEGKLVFAKLHTTDDEAEVTLFGAELQALGQIQLDFWRGTRNETTAANPLPPISNTNVGVASESGKKLGSTISTTSQELYKHDRNFVSFERYDKDKPFHRLSFSYRSRPVLELMGIITAPLPQVQAERPRVETCQAPKRARAISDPDKKVIVPVPEGVEVEGKDMLAARVKDLENQVQRLSKRVRVQAGGEVPDLTGEDSD